MPLTVTKTDGSETLRWCPDSYTVLEEPDRPRWSFRASACIDLERRFNASIDEDLRDRKAADDEVPDNATCVRAMTLVHDFTQHVFPSTAIKYAGFVEDGGIISFIIESTQTNRRLNLIVRGDRDDVVAVHVDENLKAWETRFDADQQTNLKELAGWLLKGL